MSASRLEDLANRIANPDADERDPAKLLEALTEIRDSTPEYEDQAPGAYVEAAVLLVSHLVQMGPLSTSEVLSLVAKLIGVASKTFEERTPAALPKEGAEPSGSGKETSIRLIGEMLLGEVMVALDFIRREDVDAAIRYQQQHELPFGEALIQMELASWEDVQAGLRYQDSCRDVAEAAEARRSVDRGRITRSDYGSMIGARKVDLVTDILLGELLVARNAITEADLKRALSTQRATGMRIGESLVSNGACEWDQIERAREVQRQTRSRAKGRGFGA